MLISSVPQAPNPAFGNGSDSVVTFDGSTDYAAFISIWQHVYADAGCGGDNDLGFQWRHRQTTATAMNPTNFSLRARYSISNAGTITAAGASATSSTGANTEPAQALAALWVVAAQAAMAPRLTQTGQMAPIRTSH